MSSMLKLSNHHLDQNWKDLVTLDFSIRYNKLTKNELIFFPSLSNLQRGWSIAVSLHRAALRVSDVLIQDLLSILSKFFFWEKNA